MKNGFVIPVYRHGATLEAVVKSLLSFNFPIIVVDDGNDEENRAQIAAVAKQFSQVSVLRRTKNGGKGRAMIDGILQAKKMGLTHVLQLESDGQHDSGKAEHFFELSRQNPQAVICGYPEYEADAPKSRVNGRKFANFWIHLVTLSCDIKDAMIGFRIYPVDSFVKILNRTLYIDGRMGFDIEILVRLFWKGIKIISEPVKVFYPQNGISNYRYFHDTVRVSLTYARLCIGMIIRIPLLLKRKISNNK